MSWKHTALLAGGALLALAVLDSPLRRLLGLLGEGLDRLLAELLAAIDHGRAALAALRARVASGAGVLTLLGALPLAAGAVLLAWTDFSVTVATVKSLSPVDLGDWQLTVFGRPFGIAESSAVTLVVLHVLTGVVLLEALGVTRFFPVERLVASRRLRVVRIGALAALVGLGAISAGLAAWRTEQLRSLASLGDLGSDGLLPVSGDLSTPAPAAPTPAPAAAAPRWIDRLPTPLMAVLAFVVPVAGAVAAASGYFLALSVAGLGLALAGLPLAALGLVTRLLRLLVAWIVQVLGGLLDLFTTPACSAAHALSQVWSRLVATRRPRTAQPEGPERTVANPDTASEPASLRASMERAGQSPVDGRDLEAHGALWARDGAASPVNGHRGQGYPIPRMVAKRTPSP